MPTVPPHTQNPHRTEPTLRAFYGAAPWPPPPPDAFASWFPAAARTPPPTPPPTALVIAFACAGSAEDMYTSEGTGPRRAPSSLLAWVAESGARLLAAQLPGRALRRGDPAPASAQAVAGEVLPLIAPLIMGSREEGERHPPTPYIILGHSLGAWLAFELAAAAASAGLPPPARLIVSAMPAPSIGPASRPWHAQAGLDAEGLRTECRAWGIAEAVFEPAVWTSYECVLRADFRLFDEYVWRGERGGGGRGSGESGSQGHHSLSLDSEN